MRSKILEFENFLKDQSTYDENVNFWKKIILRYNPDFREWMSDSYGNGVIIKDGNPLIALKLGNIAIRIIQLERDSLKPKFASWVKKYEDFEINELVICIQPYQTIYDETEKLIDLFFKNRFQRFQRITNFKYNSLLNRNRTSFLVKNYNAIASKKAIVYENLSIDREVARIVVRMANNLAPNDSVFKVKGISRLYNLSVKKAHEIDFELGNRVDVNNAKRINKDFENMKNQLEKLKMEVESR